jgi:hypothetical protein
MIDIPRNYEVRKEVDYVFCPKTLINRHIPVDFCDSCHYFINFKCKYRELYHPLNGMRKK